LSINGRSIWLKCAVLNERRGAEGFYHLVHADRLIEAVDELCSFESLVLYILSGQGSL
jgi:hypothetical protein